MINQFVQCPVPPEVAFKLYILRYSLLSMGQSFVKRFPDRILGLFIGGHKYTPQVFSYHANCNQLNSCINGDDHHHIGISQGYIGVVNLFNNGINANQKAMMEKMNPATIDNRRGRIEKLVNMFIHSEISLCKV